jgi:MAE_28990/MAE_18760-like HEPN
MNWDQLYAELESDREWREEEIRTFQNRGAKLESQSDQERYRRALVLLLYAHYEGFCKFALTLYASAINRSGIVCGKAEYAIAAASLASVFRDLRNPNKKSDIFRQSLPDDAKLHQFAREREFVERTAELEKLPVKISDDVVDTESNLSPTVLKKNLYRLGLPHQKFDTYSGDINKLLAIRNGISHGSLRDGVEEKLYRQLRSSMYSVMTGISVDLMKALHESAYART